MTTPVPAASLPVPIPVGISTCLLGERVRYDGNHKRDAFLVETLGPFVRYVPVCPEVECGLGVPREAMRLVGDPAAPRLVTIHTRRDLTARMQAWIRGKLDVLAREDLCGFIFKSGSPSSGMERVKVYADKGMPSKTGVGLFARAFMDRFPLVPAEDEGRLNDPLLRETFIEAIFTLARWRATLAAPRRRAAVVDFHSRHKFLVLAHSPDHYRRLGRLAAEAGRMTPAALAAAYQELLLEALRRPATPGRHANVLQHILGFFREALSAGDKQDVLSLLEQYRRGWLPLVVPLTLIRHFARRHPHPYLTGQVYLDPHPIELQLRNHA